MLSGLARVLLLTLGLVVLAEGVQFAVQGSDYFLYRVFAPRREAARREVFEQSKSYNDGMAQEIWAMKVQYQRADATGKASLASTIAQRTAAYDTSLLPLDLQRFVDEIRAQQLGN